MVRPGPNRWAPLGDPNFLEQGVRLSLRRLHLGCLDLVYLHRIDQRFELSDQLGRLKQLKDDGLVKHIGLSKVGIEDIERAREIVEISAVQNKCNSETSDIEVIEYCDKENIPYIAYSPFGGGAITGIKHKDAIKNILSLSDSISVIPGSTKIDHVKELQSVLGG